MKPAVMEAIAPGAKWDVSPDEQDARCTDADGIKWVVHKRLGGPWEVGASHGENVMVGRNCYSVSNVEFAASQFRLLALGRAA